ncbi:bifunctional diaminohydroxyphosphoribosylaminopyrimidine deaminase/5-amino-6-(5-phosphoribosylamino)uracil reductase RibD [Brachybacterium subflavum]|uniref:bifunctional diaminohydroxyphosphoribosylaminopyrimidine deaminase/5-amino-6-(5-phosphoribosylamino)uracil reductase RibD n=1 Tax=Brachybacterium subflavum TaxID=2585206 RepID=UPI0029D40E19|nr:dihydrofolate reductase family protein [Brachybacterium subflavum]
MHEHRTPPRAVAATPDAHAGARTAHAAAATPDELAAMDRALALAARGPADDANPRVGCVLLAPDGTALGEGWHRGAGTPHAEVAALADARSRGSATRGATAVVTLEPCAHTGRTGPCAEALREAGISRLVFALEDPGAASGGGAGALAAAGVDVVGGVRAQQSRELVAGWFARTTAAADSPTPASAPEDAHRAESGPSPVHLVLKTATSLDGKVAAGDGTSHWITGEASRAHAHSVRAQVDAILVGTGTLLADDPSLTARPAATPQAAPAPGPTSGGDAAATAAAGHQPLRVVVGLRDVPSDARVRGDDGRFVHLRTRDPHEVLAALAERGVRRAVLEGGPQLATAFLRAGLVDEIHAYLAPLHLGDPGRSAIGALDVATLADAPRWRTSEVHRLDEDVLLIARRGDPSP